MNPLVYTVTVAVIKDACINALLLTYWGGGVGWGCQHDNSIHIF